MPKKLTMNVLPTMLLAKPCAGTGYMEPDGAVPVLCAEASCACSEPLMLYRLTSCPLEIVSPAVVVEPVPRNDGSIKPVVLVTTGVPGAAGPVAADEIWSIRVVIGLKTQIRGSAIFYLILGGQCTRLCFSFLSSG